MSDIQLIEEWKEALSEEFTKPYMQQLKLFLRQEAEARRVLYPKGREIFNALNCTPLSKVKVVILGQDPYHGAGQAHGLSFSVPRGVCPPPSLVNIFQELHSDLDCPIPKHGELLHWAEQGVLLLNTVLTVRKGQAASHRGKGWEQFTDKIIHVLNEWEEPIVFLLWGSFAQSKIPMIDTSKHVFFRAPHPSPLSAHRGFFGCQHFSQANSKLRYWGKEEIDWTLPN